MDFELIEINKAKDFLFINSKCDYLEFYINQDEFFAALNEFNKIKSGK